MVHPYLPIDPNACEPEGSEAPGPRRRSPADRRVPALAPPEILLLVEQLVRRERVRVEAALHAVLG